MRRKTNEEFIKEVYGVVGDEYSITSSYKNSREKIGLKHNVCGFNFKMFPFNFLRGQRCPKCGGSLKKTTKQYKEEVYALVQKEYTVLEEYKNSKTNIKTLHNKCGHVWRASPNSFLRGSRCPKCYGTPKKTQEEFVTEVYETVGEEYSVIGEYLGSNKKIDLIHNKCSNIYSVRAQDFLKGYRCPLCSGRYKRSQIEYEEEVFSLVGKEYTVIGEYKSRHAPIKMQHEECSSTYYVAPRNFIKGQRCPECYSSLGELRISEILNSYKVKYESQYKTLSCTDKNPLPFDFAIRDNISNKLILIEFDGIQHFKPIDFFGGIDNFESQIKRDNIKNKYCFENKIPLLRIPYWKLEDVEYILFDFLVEHGVIEEL